MRLIQIVVVTAPHWGCRCRSGLLVSDGEDAAKAPESRGHSSHELASIRTFFGLAPEGGGGELQKGFAQRRVHTCLHTPRSRRVAVRHDNAAVVLFGLGFEERDTDRRQLNTPSVLWRVRVMSPVLATVDPVGGS